MTVRFVNKKGQPDARKGRPAADPPRARPAHTATGQEDATATLLAAIGAAEARHAAILESSLDCIVTIDHEGIVRDFNPAAVRTFGYAKEEAIGALMVEMIVPPDLREAHRKGMARYLASGDGRILGKRIEIMAMRRDQTIFPVELAITRVAAPGPPVFTANLRDISDRRSAAKRLVSAEERYRTLVEQLPAVVYIAGFGENAAWQYVSPQIETLLGFTPQEWLADPGLWARQVHPADLGPALAAEGTIQRHGPEQSQVAEYRMLTREGREVWVRDEAVVIEGDGDGPQLMRGVIVDITERRRIEERLSHQAFYDTLTGLPNRSLFMECLQKALDPAVGGPRMAAVLFLDIDDFKVINDSLGHAAGDELLIQVGRRMAHSIRDTDTAARFGGDEFTVLLVDLPDAGEAIGVAQRIGRDAERPFSVAGRELTISVSIGISLAGLGGDAEDLMRQADVAMYRAKENGKARLEVYEEQMSVEAWTRLDVERDLRRAIEHGQLEVYYQPVVELETGIIRELEALVRWRHPERGLLLPGEFIPLAEACGLIVPIDRLVLVEACRQTASWQRRHAAASDLAVSVNLSASQFRDHDIVGFTAAALTASGLAASDLRLEITESAAVFEGPLTDSIVRDLRAAGVGLVIDDFGTGYASLNYLKRFPVDALKIDRSFVAGLGRVREDTAIVRAAVAFARGLGVRATAEGVETEDQVRLLREIECDRGQGFLFAVPMAADAIGRLLAAGHRYLPRPGAGATGAHADAKRRHPRSPIDGWRRSLPPPPQPPSSRT